MTLQKGMLLTWVTIGFWAFNNLFYDFVADHDIKMPVFAVTSYMATTFFLLLFSGPGKLANDAIRDAGTFIYAFMSLLQMMSTVAMYMYMDPAEGGFLQRVTIPLSLLVAWFFMAKVVSRKEWTGAIITAAGVGIVFQTIPDANTAGALFFLTGMALCQAIKTFVIEKHKAAGKAVTVRDKARVTAYASLACALVFSIVMLFGSLVKAQGGNPVAMVSFFPDLQDFYHLPTIAVACIFALISAAPEFYTYFYAVKSIGAISFLRMIAFVPVIILVMDYIKSLFGFGEFHLDAYILIGGLIILVGALYPKTSYKFNMRFTKKPKGSRLTAQGIRYVELYQKSMRKQHAQLWDIVYETTNKVSGFVHKKQTLLDLNSRSGDETLKFAQYLVGRPHDKLKEKLGYGLGICLDKDMVEHANNKHGIRGKLEFKAMDVMDIDKLKATEHNSFGVVMNMNTLGFIEDKKTFFKKLNKITHKASKDANSSPSYLIVNTSEETPAFLQELDDAIRDAVAFSGYKTEESLGKKYHYLNFKQWEELLEDMGWEIIAHTQRDVHQTFTPEYTDDFINVYSSSSYGRAYYGLTAKEMDELEKRNRKIFEVVERHCVRDENQEAVLQYKLKNLTFVARRIK